MESHTCKICNQTFETGKKLSNHISSNHKIDSIEYTIKCCYNGIRPLCKNCGKETRYVAFSFKQFCKDCSHVAEKLGGQKGGKAPAWNSGLTKETDERLAKQAAAQTGENNAFWGRQHTETSIQKMRVKQTSNAIRLMSEGKIGPKKYKSCFKFNPFTQKDEWMHSSWETKFLDECINENIPVYKNAKFTISYIAKDNIERQYVPDFLTLDDSTIYEVKGVCTDADLLKFDAAKKWCDERNMKFIVISYDSHHNKRKIIFQSSQS